MKPLDEQTFYEQIGNVPDLPCSLYGSIEKKTFKRHFLQIRMLSVAAVIILLIGITSVIYIPQRDQPDVSVEAYDEEILSELILVHEYLNGYDIQDIEEDYLLSIIW